MATTISFAGLNTSYIYIYIYKKKHQQSHIFSFPPFCHPYPAAHSDAEVRLEAGKYFLTKPTRVIHAVSCSIPQEECKQGTRSHHVDPLHCAQISVAKKTINLRETLLCTRTVGTPPTKHLICKWRKQCSSHNAHKHYRFHINIPKKCCIQYLANTDNKKESMVYLRQARHS